MRSLYFLVLFILPFMGWGQSDERIEASIEYAEKENFTKAIEIISQEINEFPRDFFPRYLRAYYNYYNNDITKAINDVNVAISLEGEFGSAYELRANLRAQNTDYLLAIDDYKTAAQLDSSLTYNLVKAGLILEKLGRFEEACQWFYEADSLKSGVSENFLEDCQEDRSMEDFHVILDLKKKAKSKKYGYHRNNPIQVGEGPRGGPSNQQDYLELLRDENGKIIKYRRVGSCCGYKLDSAPFGYAMLDEYEIVFTNRKGKTQTKKLYISFYEYETPKIPYNLFGPKSKP